MLSEILAQPGPTDSVFDVLAAVASMTGTDARVAMLGFAAGGMIAPLRALGSEGAVRAVDLDLSKVPLFEELCGSWAGDVRVSHDEAGAWLSRQRSRFDVVIEDLSIEVGDDVGKPKVSFTKLPGLIHRHLARSGIAVINVLPMAGWSWREVTEALCHPWRGRGAQIVFTEYVNRFVVVGAKVPAPAALSRELRGRLQSIGSEIASKFSVRRLA